ncbi:ComEC/Rec2 family competence protein [Panacibacter sp. DH6]|uniref:ComEC/Rec2 family competence protein n=1 Tax=Panacibacter microcysteis TaxID=2793269 RepID=A0A931E3W9_9BACT|nr:ComEC/Rec2 family competence protein [Panacibacter microcysteis]MBG9374689.1 ComEC/Rec2 family competence protein [Panacibacter microcysteis]
MKTNVFLLFCIGCCGAILLLVYSILPRFLKYKLSTLQGVLILLLFFITGAVAVYIKDVRNDAVFFGNYSNEGIPMLVKLEEPIVTKERSYKALASVKLVKHDQTWKSTTGNILLYFKKDSAATKLTYGSRLIITKPLQQIKNNGNPGAFHYSRYCLFHGITAQVYLNENDYTLVANTEEYWLDRYRFKLRDAAIATLQEYIPGVAAQGVAEALLIGYREDLDKDLVQAYSNTGVVHIIAISGLHLGMIYALLVWLFKRFSRFRFVKWLRPVVILLVLWAFTLVAGAAPSIMRSAVMFSFIVLGETIGRRTNMYNTLAASAFCMLISDPFMLWDVGFLLSYAAVISIITFRKPIYNWLFYQNKLLNGLWGLTSVTLSAQVLTIPIVVFYFHQFPNFFLVTNFVAVPLSGIILYGEILLLIIAPIIPLAKFIGYLLGYMLTAMNGYIENINALPVAVWNNLQLSVTETWLLYGVFVCVAAWLMLKRNKMLIAALSFACAYSIILSADYIKTNGQQKLVVYNVNKHTAIDLLQGDSFHFSGSDDLRQDGFLRNFHLKPARVLYRANIPGKPLITANSIYTIHHKKVLWLSSNITAHSTAAKIPVDILVISANRKIDMNQLQQAFDAKLIIFDSSNPLWKIQQWKKDCDSLHLRFHSIPGSGAFVMDL